MAENEDESPFNVLSITSAAISMCVYVYNADAFKIRFVRGIIHMPCS